MADEIKRDTVDYRDPTPFDNSKLQSLSEISKAMRHKTYGEDTREAMAQQGEALAKLMQETGGNQSAEVAAARGNFELLGIREDAQDNAIAVANSRLANKADKTYIDDYLSQVSYVPETVASLDELKTKYPTGKPGLFVVADNGHKYIWTNNDWKDAGAYQSQGIVDLSIKNRMISDDAIDFRKIADKKIKNKRSTNIFDPNKTSSGAMGLNGVADNGNWIYTEPMAVTSGDEVSFNVLMQRLQSGLTGLARQLKIMWQKAMHLSPLRSQLSKAL
ncbi:protein of unknown function [Latilactobacillus sakei]|uniref:hypothetical protein n=1 Tax=Latilactobacillus sakei TaxID=1599 RepID=UPI000C6F41C1|nr:hypothetical protein [Latilactobacillus sakei]SON67275.1 protein of unknown function [Latilactobacillus sakei]